MSSANETPPAPLPPVVPRGAPPLSSPPPPPTSTWLRNRNRGDAACPPVALPVTSAVPPSTAPAPQDWRPRVAPPPPVGGSWPAAPSSPPSTTPLSLLRPPRRVRAGGSAEAGGEGVVGGGGDAPALSGRSWSSCATASLLESSQLRNLEHWSSDVRASKARAVSCFFGDQLQAKLNHGRTTLGWWAVRWANHGWVRSVNGNLLALS